MREKPLSEQLVLRVKVFSKSMAIDQGISTATDFIWAESTQGQPQAEARNGGNILIMAS